MGKERGVMEIEKLEELMDCLYNNMLAIEDYLSKHNHAMSENDILQSHRDWQSLNLRSDRVQKSIDNLQGGE